MAWLPDNYISRSQYSRNLHPHLLWKVWTWVVKRTILREQTVFTSVIFWSCVSHWITLLGVSSLLPLTFSLWKQKQPWAEVNNSERKQELHLHLNELSLICDMWLNKITYLLSLRQKYSGHFHLTRFFLFLARLLVLSMLFTAVNSPNLAQGKRTVKCPNNLDWDCSKRYVSVCVVRLDGHFIAILCAVEKWRN